MDPLIDIELKEWDSTDPGRDSRLRGMSLAGRPEWRTLAESLRSRIDIRERHDGIEISTGSFVGRIVLGPLRICVRPKLHSLHLTPLFKYAYGVGNVSSYGLTASPTASSGIEDLLVSLLRVEVEDLIHRGLSRHYVKRESALSSPRGQILISEFVRRAGVPEATLPCRFFDRTPDWTLNQILRDGLLLAGDVAEDADLRRHMQLLASRMQLDSPASRPTMKRVETGIGGLNRLTQAYRPALEIIRLLLDGKGVVMEESGESTPAPGFLFDMNMFFQRLLLRFLQEHADGATIGDEDKIRRLFSYGTGANPKRRRAPTPRPDFALYLDGAVDRFLDAKYRDLWDRSLPPEWLYQLVIYAMGSPRRTSILLYASMTDAAVDARIDADEAVRWSGAQPASVILRPVPMTWLATKLQLDPTRERQSQLRLLAARLISEQTLSDSPSLSVSVS